MKKAFILMARIFFKFFTENNPVRETGKTNNIPDVNWLKYDTDSMHCWKSALIVMILSL